MIDRDASDAGGSHLGRRPLRVLFLTRYPMAGASSRYRVYQYLPDLEKLDVSCTVQSFMSADMYQISFSKGRLVRKTWEALKAVWRRFGALAAYTDYDILYLQRELLPFGPPLVERWLKKRGAVLVFDYDDALFIKKPSRYNPHASWLRSTDKVRQIFGTVDCVVAGNDWLRDEAAKSGVAAVTVEVAEDTVRIQPHAPHTNDSPVTIGWLGSTSTVKYLRLIEPVLVQVARRYPDARFEIMGGGEFQMEGVPWKLTDWSLAGELEALKRFDIGLMPLPGEEWARGKSGGKARTYMAAGVVPVCSAIGYNLELISQGRTGLLCSSADEWLHAIVSLIEDASFRQRISIAARADVETRFSPAGQALGLRAVFDSLTTNSPG